MSTAVTAIGACRARASRDTLRCGILLRRSAQEDFGGLCVIGGLRKPWGLRCLLWGLCSACSREDPTAEDGRLPGDTGATSRQVLPFNILH